MLIGYMRVSSGDERQVVDLQLDALLAAGVDERHLHQDKQSGGRDDRVGLKTCLAGLRAGDVLVVWKLDRLGRSLSHLVRILEDLKGRGVAFRSLTEGIDTTTPHGEFLYNLFGTLAQYERSLIRERVNAGLAAARRRGRRGGRPPAIDPETVEQIVAALDSGSSKSAVCRTFKVARSTLNDTLERIGWSGAGQHGSETSKPNAQKPRAGEGEASQPRGEGTCLIPSSVPGHRGGCPQVSGSDWGATARARPEERPDGRACEQDCIELCGRGLRRGGTGAARGCGLVSHQERQGSDRQS